MMSFCIIAHVTMHDDVTTSQAYSNSPRSAIWRVAHRRRKRGTQGEALMGHAAMSTAEQSQSREEEERREGGGGEKGASISAQKNDCHNNNYRC